MAINFPDSPSVNDTHVVGDKTWVWNGTYWHVKQGLTVSSIKDADNDTKVQVEEGTDDDTIRFDTAGTERVTIAADGTVTVAGDLDVDGTANLDVVDIDGAVQIDSTLTVGVDGDSNDVKFYGTTASTGYLLWDKSQNDLIIGPAGSLGIGTTSPSSALTVNGSIETNSQLIVKGTNASAIAITQTDTQGGYITFNDTNGSTRMGYMGYPSNDDLHVKNETSLGRVYLSTNNTTRMTIDQSGNVGIGDTSPAQKLVVVGTAAFTDSIQTGQEAFTQEPWSASTMALGNYGSVGTQGSYASTLAWNWERGTDSGYYHLNVNSLAGAGYFSIDNNGHHWGFNSSYSPVGWPTERMRLNQTGLGIGTTSPSTALNVYTTSSVDGITLDGSTHPAMTLKGGGTVRGYIGIATAATGFFNGAATGDIVVRSNGTKLHLGTSNAAGQCMTVSGGSLGIGTTSPSSTLHVVGAIRSQAGGDGGFALRSWTASSTYASLATNGMTGSEYVALSDGTHTFISAGSGGDIYLRPSANHTGSQVKFGTGGAEFSEYTLFKKNIRVLCNSETWSEGIRIVVPANSWGGIRFKRTNAATSETGNWAFGYENNSTHDLSFNSASSGNVLYLEYDNSFVGVRTNNPIVPLHVVGGNASNYGLLVEMAMSCRHIDGKSWNNNGIANASLYLNYNVNQNTLLNWNTSTGRVYANTSALTGSTMIINGGQFGYSSSRAAIKDDIRDVTGGIDTLKALRPVRFRFKPEAIGDGTNEMVAFDERIGFVAEEMASVSHELATWEWLNDDGSVWLDDTDNGGDERPSLEEAVPIGWETDAVVSVTVAALQELIERVEALENA